MSRSSLRAIIAATAASAVSAGLLVVSPAQAADTVTINVVAMNDFHGQVDNNLVQWASTVEQLMADGTADNSLLLAAGDNFGMSAPASAAHRDNPSIDVLNTLGLDATAVGNHEFDSGYDDLVNRVMKRANFPFLGANVTKSNGSPALDASKVFDVAGLRVAVVGAVTNGTPLLTSPSNIVGLRFGDPVAAINKEVARLNALPQSDRPEVIIAAVHEGAEWGTWSTQGLLGGNAFTSLADGISPDVDAIIAGHTHKTYTIDSPVPGDPSRTRPVIQTGERATNVGQIKLTVDANTGEVKAYTMRNVARSTGSDADLIAQNPKLAEIKKIRDEAMGIFSPPVDLPVEEETPTDTETEEPIEEVETPVDEETEGPIDEPVDETPVDEETETPIDEPVDETPVDEVDDEEHRAAAEAKVERLKQRTLAAAAKGKKRFDKAAEIKATYLELLNLTQKNLKTIVRTRLAYYAAMMAGDYPKAAKKKVKHDLAMSIVLSAAAKAGPLKVKYDTKLASGHKSYAKANRLLVRYEAAVAALAAL